MSEINANIVISPIDLGVTVNTNQLTFTPDAVSLNIYAGGGGPATSLNANIANVHIYDGVNGYVLQTDGTGNLSWTAQSGGGGNGAPGGSNTQVQYNNSGVFAGNTGFTYNQTTGLLSSQYYSGNANGLFNIIASNIVGTVANATYALSAGTANTVTTAAQPNITSTGILTSLSVTGNITNGNITGGNLVSANYFTGTLTTAAQPNITSVGTLTSLSVTGNISSGNANLGNLAISNFFSGNGSLLTGINGANVSNVANANYANFAGTVVNAAQGNITSVGTLTDLKVSNSKIHLGFLAGNTSQGNLSIAIGANAALTSQAINAVAIGANAGRTSQGLASVAVGNRAGESSQGFSAVAIGTLAAFSAQGNYAVAIGSGTGQQNQGLAGIAIGTTASGTYQGNYAIAIGSGAAGSGFQGAYSIAIGYSTAATAQGANSIAIGSMAAGNTGGPSPEQPPNNILLNATGVNFNATIANSFFVKPIRDVTGNVDFTVTLKYNPTTGEIGYV